MTGRNSSLDLGLVAALLLATAGVCGAAMPKAAPSTGVRVPRPAATAPASGAPTAAQPAPAVAPGAATAQPAPAVKTAAPAVRPIPQMPQPSVPARLMTTPRAKLAIHPRIADPQAMVARSGRMGCAFSFRSVLGGIIEYLFPGTGLFRRGESLFRIYDAGILTDLTAAERAMANYDVQPLLIARSPRRIAAASTGLPVGEVPGFPSPTAARRRVPLRTDAAAAAKAPAGGAKLPAQEPPALNPAPQEDGEAAEEVEVIRGPEQPAAKTARLKPTAEVPQVDLAPFEKAVSEAEQAYNSAQSRVHSCEEDCSAKQKLVELGALPAGKAEEAAAALAEASMEAADAKARVGVARERLSDAKSRAEKAAALAAKAAEEAAAEVDVIRGSSEAPKPRKNHRSQGARIAKADPGVEVIRGSGAETARSAPRPAATRSSNEPPLIPGVGDGARRRPQLTHSSGRDTVPPMVSAGFPAKPKELDRLAEQRWTEFAAPSDGFVVERATKNGDQVQPGQELFKVINNQWARAFFTVGREDVERFAPGTVVTVTFDDYPSVAFEGFVSSLSAEEGGDTARAEIVMFCRQGYFGTDAFGTLQWLALATPLDQSAEDTAPVKPVAQSAPEQQYRRDPQAQMAMVPQDIWELSVDPESLPHSEDVYEGHLQLADLCGPDDVSATEGPQRQRLAKLLEWREGFVDGMTRTLFSERVVLTYPKSGEIRRAIERMATGRVSNVPNRCARTMREALGWGLGDAHVWARMLPTRGYVARRDGLARPGDILVWPFTYPPRNSQHIGVAVQQNGKLMLLSNLNGNLGTVDVQPGYIAFYKPGA